MNPHIVLGVTPTASFDELKRAYRQAVLRYHPDSAIGNGDPEKLNAVMQAYQDLKKGYENRSYRTVVPPPQRPKPAAASPKPRESKIWVDRATASLPVEELFNMLEFSDNPYVLKTAVKALSLKPDPKNLMKLTDLLNRLPLIEQCSLIRIVGEMGYVQASSTLLPRIMDSKLDIAIESIRSLEGMNPRNREMILQALRSEQKNLWHRLLNPFKSNFDRLPFGRKSNNSFGKILLSNQNIDPGQLELALLLQKKHPILIGSILKKLGYISVTEIQEALTLQRQPK